MIRLTTPRLMIRDHVPGDLPTHHELLSDPKAMRFLQDIMTHDLAQSRENLRQAMEKVGCPDRIYYFLRMEDRATNAHIGEIGYTVTGSAPRGKLAEVGYFIRATCWGQGYTAEALREVLRFAFEEDGVYRISCGCLKENGGSERVMQKCGMIREGELKEFQLHEGKLKDRMVYRLLRPEWESMRK